VVQIMRPGHRRVNLRNGAVCAVRSTDFFLSSPTQASVFLFEKTLWVCIHFTPFLPDCSDYLPGGLTESLCGAVPESPPSSERLSPFVKTTAATFSVELVLLIDPMPVSECHLPHWTRSNGDDSGWSISELAKARRVH
jgi:hypothetical protein